MQAPENGNTLTNLGQSFANALSSVLSDVCGQTWITRVSDQPVPATPLAAEAVYFKLKLTGALEGDAVLSLHTGDLASLRMQTAGASQLSAEDAARLLGSSLEAATSTWSQAFSEYGAVSVRVEAVADASTVKDHVVELRGQVEGSATPVSFFLFLNSRVVATAQSVAARSLAYPAAAPSANLDLVLDVELNVTLRFGQRQLSLREVLDLTSGSVVELDRQVDEPVELVLDGRVVARGEAVIIDGVYGMRITQVLQPLVA